MHDTTAWEALPEAGRVSARGIEVGHIFYFGTKYSEPMRGQVQGPDGKPVTVHMGSYGIGPTRVVAAMIEASHDKDGIVWPVPIAPFEVAVINLKAGDKDCDAAAESVMAKLTAAGVDAVYDDTDDRAGAKFATMDLVGIPYQVVVGPKGVKAGEIELTVRRSGERKTAPADAGVAEVIAAVKAGRDLA